MSSIRGRGASEEYGAWQDKFVIAPMLNIHKALDISGFVAMRSSMFSTEMKVKPMSPTSPSTPSVRVLHRNILKRDTWIMCIVQG
jgi:hypothetical protein